MPLPGFFGGGGVDIKGTVLPTPQASRKRFVKGTGWTTVDIWESPSEVAAEGLANDLVLAGYTDVDILQSAPGVWRVEGSVAGQGQGDPPDPPIDEWTLDSSAQMRAVTDHPTFLQLGQDTIKEIELAAEDNEEIPTVSQALQTLANTLYGLIAKGKTTYYEEQPVLRHSQTVATFTEVVVSMSQINKIFTHESLPAGITPAVVAAIDSIPFGPAKPLMTQGWLKMSTIVRQNVFSRAEIIEEWQFGYWEDILYADVT